MACNFTVFLDGFAEDYGPKLANFSVFLDGFAEDFGPKLANFTKKLKKADVPPCMSVSRTVRYPRLETPSNTLQTTEQQEVN